MDTKAQIAHGQRVHLSALALRKAFSLGADRPFVVRVGSYPMHELNAGGTRSADSASEQAVYFQSLDELMEFVLGVLTEDEVTFTQRVVRER
ncbi:MAG: hypothetical protein ACRERD_23845 [Candidatus Binatia bacterium]